MYSRDNSINYIHTHVVCKNYVLWKNVIAGLPAEMYYIRDDLINTYALNFTLLIPPTVNDLYFTWENTGGQQVRSFFQYHTIDS